MKLAVRCGLLLLALLAGARAERCTYAEYGQQRGYPVSFRPYVMYEQSVTLYLPFDKAGCSRPAGSWVRVCADDDLRPVVNLYDVREVYIERRGYRGGVATVYSGGFCKDPVRTHGLGAANVTPTVVHVKGKN